MRDLDCPFCDETRKLLLSIGLEAASVVLLDNVEGALGSPAFAAVPEYTAKKAGCPMIMDGILDEPAWQKSQSVGPFQFHWYESGEKEQTEAKSTGSASSSRPFPLVVTAMM
jgi:hypothetical protein